MSAFEVPIDLWGTDEQRAYWKRKIQEQGVFGTYGKKMFLNIYQICWIPVIFYHFLSTSNQGIIPKLYVFIQFCQTFLANFFLFESHSKNSSLF